jgi:predicted nucleic acid-binding protein
MVLVDTSVWIRFLANRPPFAAQLDRLLDTGEAAGHDLIYGELLIGDLAAGEICSSRITCCTASLSSLMWR